MMRCLSFVSVCCLLLVCCATPYKALQPAKDDSTSVHKFQPVFEKVLYRCVVDGKVILKPFYLSGLLLIKKMPDSTTRVVFQNEMGFAFFDFEWSAQDSFHVNSIIPQLNKTAVIRLLEKDLDLLLMKNLKWEAEVILHSGSETLHRFPLSKGFAYYIVQNGELMRIENIGRQRVITISLGGKRQSHGLPDSVFIRHHKANFSINLKRLPDAEG